MTEPTEKDGERTPSREELAGVQDSLNNLAQSALELKALYMHLNDELMQGILTEQTEEHEDTAALVSLTHRLITRLSQEVDELVMEMTTLRRGPGWARGAGDDPDPGNKAFGRICRAH